MSKKVIEYDIMNYVIKDGAELKIEVINELLSEFQRANEENERLKSELHSKTEYIQEQRDIIEKYRKEIEMYKKCQGNRASKREEKLLAEIERLYSLCNIYKTYYKAKHDDKCVNGVEEYKESEE